MDSQEYCPVCRELRDVRFEIQKWNFVDSQGRDAGVFERQYFCEVCETFLRSEDVMNGHQKEPVASEPAPRHVTKR